jgi:MoaA/NifB/PqqE/SkfB family radical SAM enzyme
MGEGGRIYIDDGDVEGRGSPEDNAEETNLRHRITVDENGSLTIPSILIEKLGLEPGAEAEIASGKLGLEVRPNVHSLSRLYVEPTSRCNLACRMCIRNSWNEPVGDMDLAIFDQLASQLRRFPHLASIMFGGFGEPTAHPDILHMIRTAKNLDVMVELTSNGASLDETMIAGLIEAGLDRLWISLDGVTEESFNAIRQGASFDNLLANLRRFREMNRRSPRRIEAGIAFVVMKRNIDDLRKIDRLIRAAGARFVSISNLIPYTQEMEREMVCTLALTLETLTATSKQAEINLPRLDINDRTKEAIFSLLRTYDNLSLMGNSISAAGQSCRFIKDRCTFIRWDGKVSPCMGLLHTHKTYLNGLERTVSAYTLGDVGSGDLYGIWNSDEYTRFREKVRGFLFSPCHVCGGCSFLEKNEEDCCGNTFPVCGSCLWAQGIIQCP